MIRIIKGVYGYVGDNGIPSPKTVGDKPFSVKAEEEERLIALGVAERVEDINAAETATTEAKAEEEVKDETKVKKTSKKSKKKTADKDDEEPPVLEAVAPE